MTRVFGELPGIGGLELDLRGDDETFRTEPYASINQEDPMKKRRKATRQRKPSAVKDLSTKQARSIKGGATSSERTGWDLAANKKV